MKAKTCILLMLLSFFIASVSVAGEPVPVTKAGIEAIETYLEKELSYPTFASENNVECCVSISVIVQDDGSLLIDAANCSSCDMKDHVVKSINDAKVDKTLAQYAGQNALIKVKFKLIK